jgi:histidyl-tRNA synthetase
MKKQFEYADKKRIPYVCVIGSEEMEKGIFNLKNMASGTQTALSTAEMIEHLKNNP